MTEVGSRPVLCVLERAGFIVRMKPTAPEWADGSRDLDEWGICGVGLREADRKMCPASMLGSLLIETVFFF
jgi:hypothetical protein